VFSWTYPLVIRFPLPISFGVAAGGTWGALDAGGIGVCPPHVPRHFSSFIPSKFTALSSPFVVVVIIHAPFLRLQPFGGAVWWRHRPSSIPSVHCVTIPSL